MAYAASGNLEIVIYVIGAIAVALLAVVGTGLWRQVERIERSLTRINEFIIQNKVMPAAAGTPAPAKSTTTVAPAILAQLPSSPEVPRVEQREESVATDDEPVHSRATATGEADSEAALDPRAVLDALNSADDPLTLLREVESELAALGGLAEGARPGHGAEFLDVPGALGPTLSLAARRIGAAADLLELRQGATSQPTRR